MLSIKKIAVVCTSLGFFALLAVTGTIPTVHITVEMPDTQETLAEESSQAEEARHNQSEPSLAHQDSDAPVTGFDLPQLAANSIEAGMTEPPVTLASLNLSPQILQVCSADSIFEVIQTTDYEIVICADAATATPTTLYKRDRLVGHVVALPVSRYDLMLETSEYRYQAMGDRLTYEITADPQSPLGALVVSQQGQPVVHADIQARHRFGAH